MNGDLEAGERAATDLPDPTLQLPPGSSQFAVETSPASPPTVDESQLRRGQQEDRLARYYEPCPQGEDCTGDGKHRRLFDCEQGCGFRGCSACMEVHEAEPHSSDSEITLEMFRNMRS